MTIGIAVIGAGMAGRAHAAAYRTAPTAVPVDPAAAAVRVHRRHQPGVRLLAARRFGYERSDTSWQAIAENPDIHVVSVVVANSLHREMVEGLLAAGKHVLCEKPLSDTLEDARAMADAARSADTRRTDRVHLPPGAGSRRAARAGDLRRRWAGCCTSTSATGATTPATRRARSAGATRAPRAPARSPTSAATPRTWPSSSAATSQEVSGGRFATAITERPVPLGAVIGHGHVAVSDTYEPVENDDYAGFSARFANGVGVGPGVPGRRRPSRTAWPSRSSATRVPRSGRRSDRRSST